MRNSIWAVVACCAVAAGCDYSSRQITDGERADTLYRTAMSEYAAGRLDKSIDGFEKVLRANPGNASARFQLACLLQDHRKDYLGAICNYREYEFVFPNGDKKAIARERAEVCERALAAELMRKHDLGGSVAQDDANKRLNKDKQELAKKLQDCEKRLKEVQAAHAALERENGRLRRMCLRGASDDEVLESVGSAKPAEAPSENDLLDDEGESIDRIKLSSDIDQLVSEESSENVASPFGKTVKQTKAAPPPPGVLMPLHEKRPATYVVQEGDTLYQLAIRFYGRRSAWENIRDANKAIVSPDGRIKAGQELRLP